IVLSGCGGRRRVALPTGARLGSTETGMASWYGYPYHGRRAANGEIYDMEKMTAAHRTLPVGTLLRVRNLEKNRAGGVLSTGRGPFAKGRILDLSHAAAMQIALVGPGTAKVKLTVIAAPAVIETAAASPQAPVQSRTIELYAVQVGVFTDRSNAE